MTDHSIKGKVALIAGGGKNLGGLVARDLAAHGAKAVAVHYNSPASAAETEDTLAAVRAAGAEAVAFQADLTSASAMERLFADTVAAVGRPDIAINTVGK
ncbi:MAG: SDR family NAD(P)-dependent oxidoreductase, partial [Sphingopyxis sp.]|nr:SDR family NAD(P)-dependent oxidoreductase [Sphingopyxis sp.]